MSTNPFSIFLVLTARYLVIAGIAFLIFYLLFPNYFFKKKIQKKFPQKKDYYREIIFSMLTTVIFSVIAISLRSPLIKPHTLIYTDINAHGKIYFFVSILLALFIHDTYFYWTHRLMHHPRLFKLFHLTHHRSANPSPWAAYAFNPLEAIVEGGTIFAIVFIIPIHFFAIVIFMLMMIVYNVYGHLGYEIYSYRFLKTKVGKWFNTSTNHNMHHRFFTGNYGLYFRFWDVLMGTTHPNYEETLKELLEKKKEESVL